MTLVIKLRFCRKSCNLLGKAQKGGKMIKPILKLCVNLLAGVSLFAVPIMVSHSISAKGVFGENYLIEYLGTLLVHSFAILFLACSLNRFIDSIHMVSSAREN